MRTSPHVFKCSGVPDMLRKSAVCWSTEGRWPLCLLGLSISYSLSKLPIFELLHSLLFFFSTWGLCTNMSSRCLWKAPDSCAAIACNTSLSLKMFGLWQKRKLSSCSVGELVEFSTTYQGEKKNVEIFQYFSDFTSSISFQKVLFSQKTNEIFVRISALYCLLKEVKSKK